MNTLQNRLTADEISQFLARAMRLLDGFVMEGLSILSEEDPSGLLSDISNAANLTDNEEWDILYADAQPNPVNICIWET